MALQSRAVAFSDEYRKSRDRALATPRIGRSWPIHLASSRRACTPAAAAWPISGRDTALRAPASVAYTTGRLHAVSTHRRRSYGCPWLRKRVSARVHARHLAQGTGVGGSGVGVTTGTWQSNESSSCDVPRTRMLIRWVPGNSMPIAMVIIKCPSTPIVPPLTARSSKNSRNPAKAGPVPVSGIDWPGMHAGWPTGVGVAGRVGTSVGDGTTARFDTPAPGVEPGVTCDTAVGRGVAVAAVALGATVADVGAT